MTYNPFIAALSAAAAELSSPAARRFYVNRAQQDLQTTLVLIVQFGCLAYAFGAQCRQWFEDLEQSPRRFQIGGALVPRQFEMKTVTVVAIASITHPALPAFTPIALLNPAPKPKRTRKSTPPKGKGRSTVSAGDCKKGAVTSQQGRKQS